MEIRPAIDLVKLTNGLVADLFCTAIIVFIPLKK